MRVDLSLWYYLRALLSVVLDNVTQRWSSLGLGTAAKACHESVKGKTVIVTGATSGIGLETARELALKGADVVLACRNVAAGQKVVNSWRQTNATISATVTYLDLSSLASVREFAEAWNARGSPLHVLVNNAGIFSMGVEQPKVTCDGHEEHIAVNHMGPALLSLLLLPALRRAPAGARIVNISSKMHELGSLDTDDLSFTSGRRKFSATAAYAQSKLAQVLFTHALNQRLKALPQGDLVALALHPGEVVTNVVRTLPGWLQAAYHSLMPAFCFTASEGARAPLFCATNPSVPVFAKLVRTKGLSHGPYYSSFCRPDVVATHAQSRAASDAVWAQTLADVEINEAELSL